MFPEDGHKRLVIMSLEGSTRAIADLRDFRLEEARCTMVEDEERLREVIYAGGDRLFTQTIRDLADYVDKRNDLESKVIIGCPCFPG